VSYTRFRGDPPVTEMTYEYDDAGRLVRSTSTADPDWTDFDRGLALALLAEQAATCPSCGHPISECRDPKTAGTWEVVQEVCQPSVVAQVTSEQAAEAKRRGVQIATRRTRI
jgi:hypothetical protein